MTHPGNYGEVHGPPLGEMSRRRFLRRVLGAGIGILSIEFVAGFLNFWWPNVRGGLGGLVTLGSAADIATALPEWAKGQPFSYQKARIFLVNVPAAESLVDGTNQTVADPGKKVLALYRKCPHLGCQIPQLCDKSKWFECLCHGSKYNIIGEKRAGPAPRGMDRFNVTLENGVYVVDTSKAKDGPPIGTATFDTRTFGDMDHCS